MDAIKRLKRIKLLIVAAVMLLAVIPKPAGAAGEVSLDLSQGGIVITNTGYDQGGGGEISHTVGYIISSSASTANTIQVVSGIHEITLDGVTVEIPATTAISTTATSTVCAFSIASSAEVTLSLKDGSNNTLTSAAGYAGLYVAKDAELTIKGAGVLTATGGAGRPTSSGSPTYGGGAGIGGNGYNGSHSFGHNHR